MTDEPIVKGDAVTVTDASGHNHQMYAVTSPMQDHDFIVIWVIEPDQWRDDIEPVRFEDVGPTPWPVEHVRLGWL